jgi:hypothetical protein
MVHMNGQDQVANPPVLGIINYPQNYAARPKKILSCDHSKMSWSNKGASNNYGANWVCGGDLNRQGGSDILGGNIKR